MAKKEHLTFRTVCRQMQETIAFSSGNSSVYLYLSQRTNVVNQLGLHMYEIRILIHKVSHVDPDTDMCMCVCIGSWSGWESLILKMKPKKRRKYLSCSLYGCQHQQFGWHSGYGFYHFSPLPALFSFITNIYIFFVDFSIGITMVIIFRHKSHWMYPAHKFRMYKMMTKIIRRGGDAHHTHTYTTNMLHRTWKIELKRNPPHVWHYSTNEGRNESK